MLLPIKITVKRTNSYAFCSFGVVASVYGDMMLCGKDMPPRLGGACRMAGGVLGTQRYVSIAKASTLPSPCQQPPAP